MKIGSKRLLNAASTIQECKEMMQLLKDTKGYLRTNTEHNEMMTYLKLKIRGIKRNQDMQFHYCWDKNAHKFIEE